MNFFHNLYKRKKYTIIFDQITNSEVSNKDLILNSLKLLKNFQKRGLKKGDKVLIEIENCKEYLYIIVACALGGFLACPLDPKLKKNTKDNIKLRIVPDLVITKKHNLKFEEIKDVTFKEPDYKNNFLVIQTSGTTGQNKGIVLSLKSILLSAKNYSNLSNLGKNSKILHHLPMYYMAGILNLFFSPLFATSKIILTNVTGTLEYLNFWEKVFKFRITNLNLTPTMCYALINLSSGNKITLKKISSLKDIICIGSKLHANTYKKFEKIFKINLRQCYGITECGGPITVQKRSKKLETNCGNWGKKTRIKIINNIIMIKNDFLMTGYLKNKKIEKIKKSKGFFNTLDVGRIIKDNLYISGRKKEIVKIGSELVSLYKIEEVALEYDQILESATICKEDELKGEKIYLFITKINKNFKDEIIVSNTMKYLRNELKSAEIPDDIILLEKMPLNNNNKLDKNKLLELIKK